MTRGVQLGLVVVIVIAAQGLLGCGPEASVPTPSAPSSSTPPAPVVTVPQAWPPGVFDSNVTLSGFVFEIAQGVKVPIERAWVYCEMCSEETHAGMYTDRRGFYSFKGAWATAFSIQVSKDDYQDPPGPTNTGFPNGPGWRDVVLNGNTRFDVELERK